MFYTALAGLCLALMMVIWRKDLWRRIEGGARRLFRREKSEAARSDILEPVLVPYGLAIAIGCEMAMLLCGTK